MGDDAQDDYRLDKLNDNVNPFGGLARAKGGWSTQDTGHTAEKVPLMEVTHCKQNKGIAFFVGRNHHCCSRRMNDFSSVG